MSLFSTTLPWPPSANHYKGTRIIFPPSAEFVSILQRKGLKHAWGWLRARSYLQWYLKPEAKQFFEAAGYIIGRIELIDGPVAVTILLMPPDRRRRDLDNTLKCIFDCLEHCGVVKNDHQFKRLEIEFGEPKPDGGVMVRLDRYVSPASRGSDIQSNQ